MIRFKQKQFIGIILFVSITVISIFFFLPKEVEAESCTATIYCCCGGSCDGGRSQCPGNLDVGGHVNPSGGCDADSGCTWSGSCGYWDECGGPSCDDCSCEAPTGMTWQSPPENSDIYPGVVVDWNSPTDWGQDGGEEGDGCDGCSHTSDVYYELWINGSNESARCVEASGDKLTSSQCTIKSVDSSWPGTTKTFSVKAYNGCDNQTIDRNYKFPPNETPFCNGFNVTQGRVAGSYPNEYVAARPSDPISITVSAGETDLYGNPSRIDFCYKIKQQPNPAQWVCPTIATNANSGTFTATFEDMKANFVGNPYYDTIETHGFTATSNIRDNVSPNFCNGWDMYQPSNPTPGSCDGGTCLIYIHNRNPEITSVSYPTDWIGTESESDNGLSCNDNNPSIYQMIYEDQDGSSDIDIIELSLAQEAYSLDSNNDNFYDDQLWGRQWPLNIRFAKEWRAKGGQRFANGNFFVRDMVAGAPANPTRECITISGGTTGFDHTGYDENDPDCNYSTNTSCRSYNARTSSDTVFCYAADSHSWSGTSFHSNQQLQVGGLTYNVDVYALPANNDISTFNNGYNSTLLGESDWKSGTYVAYQRGGNKVFAQLKVQFNDDGTQKWNGSYNNVWYVNDLYGKEDQTENLSSSFMADKKYNITTHVKGKTKIDLRAPEVRVQQPSPLSATRLGLEWSAEGEENLSGLSAVYGEASTDSTEPHTIFHMPNSDPYNPVTDTPLGENFLWSDESLSGASITRTETIEVGENEMGTLSFDVSAQDNACNMEDSGNQITLDSPWLITRGGLVHTQGSPDIDVKALGSTGPLSNEFLEYPFDIQKQEVGLSSELLSSGREINFEHLPFASTTGAHSIENYSDNNSQQWYRDLKNSAEGNIIRDPSSVAYVNNFVGTISGDLSNVTNGTTSCNSAPNCMISTTGDLSLTIPTGTIACNKPTAIFVNGNLTINTDITSTGVTNGCIFIVSGNVVIEGSTYKSAGSTYPKYDLIDAFIIADGDIHVREADLDPNLQFRDGLKVRGGLLSFGPGNGPDGQSLIFERSLKLNDNSLYPAEVIHHDPKYFKIAEDIFGGNGSTFKKEIGFKY
jgi:hypothetical protein